MMVLVIDNYDSFTYNLVELLRRDTEVMVRKHDEIGLSELDALPLRGILISPGPGKPADSGISAEVIRTWRGKVPILGICLGHQLLGELFGAPVVKALRPMHGKVSMIHHDGLGIFRDVPDPVQVMRYHSLVISAENFPNELVISAKTREGEIMGIRHKFDSLAGVQFHPESILSPFGANMIRNWIQSLPSGQLPLT